MARGKNKKKRPEPKGSKYPLTVYLDRELYDAVRQMAKEEGFSLSVMAGRIIRDYVKSKRDLDGAESQTKETASYKEEFAKELSEEIRSSRFTFSFDI